MRVLLAEDDPMLSKIIAQTLKNNAMAADVFVDGKSAIAAAFAADYDLILLDLGLPRIDGIEVLKEIRKKKDIPIIIISARDSVESRLAGLNGGADDYLIKPFNSDELLARIRAVLRRGGKNSQLEMTIEAGGWVLNPANMTVCKKDSEQIINLTNKEFALLNILMKNAGIIYSREMLEEKLYAWDESEESNAVDFLIHSLRKKLDKDFIKNIRGAGWIINK